MLFYLIFITIVTISAVRNKRPENPRDKRTGGIVSRRTCRNDCYDERQRSSTGGRRAVRLECNRLTLRLFTQTFYDRRDANSFSPGRFQRPITHPRYNACDVHTRARLIYRLCTPPPYVVRVRYRVCDFFSDVSIVFYSRLGRQSTERHFLPDGLVGRVVFCPMVSYVRISRSSCRTLFYLIIL